MAVQIEPMNQPKPEKKHSLLGDMVVHILLGSIIIMALATVTLLVLPPNLIHAAGLQQPAVKAPDPALDAAPAVTGLTASVSTTSGASANSTNSQAVPVQQTDPGVSATFNPPLVDEGGDCVQGYIMDIYENRAWFQGWSISLSNETAPDKILQKATSGEEGDFSFPPTGSPTLGAGTYILTLEMRDGWKAVTSAVFKVTLSGEPDHCAQVRFKLEALACLNVFKEYAVNGFGLPGWDFTADPVPPTSDITRHETTDGLGWAHFTNMDPGDWTVTEAAKVGWRLVRIEPDGTNNISLPSPRTPGQCQEMTFVNEQVGDSCICAQKVDNSGNLVANPAWEMTLTRPDGTQQTQTRNTGDDGLGTACFQHLALGDWNVAETPQLPFWVPVGPVTQTVSLTQPSESCALVKFTNQPLGCVDVTKINQLDQPLTGWSIEAQNPGSGAKDTQVTGANGTVRFYLGLGTWNFSEATVPGWTPITPSQFSVKVDHVFEPCAQVIFKNRADYACVDVWKKDYYDQKIGLPDWLINLNPAYGGKATQGTTDGTGWVRFNMLTPGNYKLSEVLKPGWLPVGVEIANTDGSKLPLAPMLPDYSTDVLNLQATGQCAVVTFYNRQANTQDPGSPTGSGPIYENGTGSCSSQYTVQHGDYLSEIARQFGITLEALLAANNLPNPNLIFAGTVLCIP